MGMSPQQLVKPPSKLHQSFQDLDHSHSKQPTWTSSQSTHPHSIKCLEPLKNSTICLSDINGSIFTGAPHQLCQMHIPNQEDISSPSTHLAVDSTCQILARCFNQSSVHLLNLADLNQKVEKKLKFAESIHCSTFYSDDLNGCLALIAGGVSNAWLMDMEMGKVFRKFGDWRLKTKRVVGVMRVGNGCLLMTQHADRSSEVWDLRLPNRPVQIVKPLVDSAGPITSTSHVDSSGRLLARADISGRLQIEELLTSRIVASIKLPEKISAVRFAESRQDGEIGCHLAVASINRQYVCEIDNTGHRLKTVGKVDKTTKIRWFVNKEEFVSISNANCVNYFKLVNGDEH